MPAAGLLPRTLTDLRSRFLRSQPDVLGRNENRAARPGSAAVHIKGRSAPRPRALRLSIDSYVR